MRPVRWSLKNQRTAPAVPVADILCRIGIGVCVITTARTDKAMPLACAQGATAMTTLAGIRRRDLLNHDTG
jgi:hypothetical protein